MGAERVIHMQLPCELTAAAQVRQAMGEWDGLGWALGDGMLVATELVNNAVLHSGCSAEELIDVEVSLRDDRLMISVQDRGQTGRSAAVREDGDVFGGMGLRVVEQLTTRWGAELKDGQRVWAEVPVASAPPE